MAIDEISYSRSYHLDSDKKSVKNSRFSPALLFLDSNRKEIKQFFAGQTVSKNRMNTKFSKHSGHKLTEIYLGTYVSGSS